MIIASTLAKGSSSSSLRLLKVPGSLSSALRITYFGAPGAARTASHLRPVGKAAPPRPDQSGELELLDHPVRPHLDGAAQRRETAVRLVVVDAGRIDHAAARQQRISGPRPAVPALPYDDCSEHLGRDVRAPPSRPPAWPARSRTGPGRRTTPSSGARRRRLARPHAEQLLQAQADLVGAVQVAGHAVADAQHGAARRGGLEEGVEADHAVEIGEGDAECAGSGSGSVPRRTSRSPHGHRAAAGGAGRAGTPGSAPARGRPPPCSCVVGAAGRHLRLIALDRRPPAAIDRGSDPFISYPHSPCGPRDCRSPWHNHADCGRSMAPQWQAH